MTQTRKKTGGYRRTQRIAHRAESTQKRRKALRHNAFRRSSYLHTQEVTGSSPAVSTTYEKSELLPYRECVRIFHFYQRKFLLLFTPGGILHPPDIFYPHIRFLPLGMTTIKKEHHLFCGRQWTLSVKPAAERAIRPHERLFPSDPPIPPTNPPFPAQSTGKGGFLIHPQNFSCSPLTIPLS